jgi:hypothetical protein
MSHDSVAAPAYASVVKIQTLSNEINSTGLCVRKPKLLVFMIALGLSAGVVAGNAIGGGFTNISSLSGLAIGLGVLLWCVVAYNNND